jgi:hypothetical protein
MLAGHTTAEDVPMALPRFINPTNDLAAGGRARHCHDGTTPVLFVNWYIHCAM